MSENCRCERLDPTTEHGGTDPRSCPEHAYEAGRRHERNVYLQERADLTARSSAAEELLSAWFRDVRALAGELGLLSNRIADDMDITLVGRANFFGARCGRYAATGETPVVAMNRLREELRKVLDAERKNVAHT
jgi:hypothetical protein